ncbi:MAG: hypothetical protein ABIP53_01335 [Candidatus Limnocylindrales bacterium]
MKAQRGDTFGLATDRPRDRARARFHRARDGAPTVRLDRPVDWADVERLQDGKVCCKAGTKVTERDVSEDGGPTHPSRTASSG